MPQRTRHTDLPVVPRPSASVFSALPPNTPPEERGQAVLSWRQAITKRNQRPEVVASDLVLDLLDHRGDSPSGGLLEATGRWQIEVRVAPMIETNASWYVLDGHEKTHQKLLRQRERRASMGFAVRDLVLEVRWEKQRIQRREAAQI